MSDTWEIDHDICGMISKYSSRKLALRCYICLSCVSFWIFARIMNARGALLDIQKLMKCKTWQSSSLVTGKVQSKFGWALLWSHWFCGVKGVTHISYSLILLKAMVKHQNHGSIKACLDLNVINEWVMRGKFVIFIQLPHVVNTTSSRWHFFIVSCICLRGSMTC